MPRSCVNCAVSFPMIELRDFQRIYVYDFEFQTPPGNPVIPHCMVAHELRSGKRIRLWADQLSVPPFPTDSKTLFVTYNAAAELSSHLAINWPMGISILDLSAEFRCQMNGRVLPDGLGLLGALSFYKLKSISLSVKEEKQGLAIRGGPF